MVAREDVFHLIDSKEKAYWLGFLYADGYITKTCVTLCLSTKDEILVDRFIDFVGDDRNKKKFYTIKLKYHAVHFNFRSKQCVSDLTELGCCNKKTTRIRLPKLSNNDLYLAFLLGFYDGDGIANSSQICSGSNLFLEDIRRHFVIPYEVRFKTNPFGSVYLLSLGMGLYNTLISNYDFSLPRKRVVKYKRYKQIYKKVPRPHFDILLPDEDLTKLAFDYSGKKLGAMFGVSESRIRDVLKRRNIPLTDKHWQQKKFNPNREALVGILEENNYNFRAIGRHYNVSDNAVRKRCRKFQIDYKNRSRQHVANSLRHANSL